MQQPSPTDRAPLALPEVLRRAHRVELEPLAHALAIRPGGMGRDRLAAAIEAGIRRAGSNDLVNLLRRKGAAPEYEVVLAELARRARVGQGAAPTEMERALALHAQSTALLKQGALAVVSLVSRVLLPLFGPLIGLFFLLWIGRRRDDVLLPVVAEVARLREVVSRRAIVALVGPPSSGKDAAIGALFGMDTGNVNPVAGSTKSVAVYPVPGGEGLEVVNTPGLGDVVEALSEETRQTLDQADLFLFLVNAQGGVRAREKAEWERVRARGAPTLVVVNKLDTLRETDRGRMLDDVAAKLGVPREQVVGAAVDPLPQLMPTPLGVHAIREWLLAQLTALGRGHLPGT